MLKNRTCERLFRGLEPPPPPDELRDRALRAARNASIADHGEKPGIWSRVWTHRGLRMAWATAVLALAIAHVAISVRPSSQHRRDNRQPAFLVAAVVTDRELADVVQLSRIANPAIGPEALETERSPRNGI